jgi:hypothetical protein
MHRSIALAFPLSLSLVSSTALAQTGTARYEVVFHSTWSASTHPGAFPDGGHFSPLIGGVHDASVRFWRPGDLASAGIEQMAERGRTSPLDREIEDAIGAGAAREVIRGGPLPRSPGTVATTFTVSREHPLVTLVTMVAPSPDWFVGVRDLALRDGDEWVDELEVELLGWDAGTDDGADFTAPDVEPSPHHDIARLDFGPFAGSNGGRPLGTFTFRRLDASVESPLYLGGGRFRVDATWADYDGGSGVAQAQPFTDDTGYFWFFSPTNVEVTIKVIDGCAANGHFWIYASGLTDVEVALAVTDLERDELFEITNELGHPFDLVRDIGAFSGCP